MSTTVEEQAQVDHILKAFRETKLASFAAPQPTTTASGLSVAVAQAQARPQKHPISAKTRQLLDLTPVGKEALHYWDELYPEPQTLRK